MSTRGQLTVIALSENLNSPSVFSKVHVGRSLVFCVVFCRSLFVLLSYFSFGHCIVCLSSIYGFRLHLWCLQTFLVKTRMSHVIA